MWLSKTVHQTQKRSNKCKVIMNCLKKLRLKDVDANQQMSFHENTAMPTASNAMSTIDEVQPRNDFRTFCFCKITQQVALCHALFSNYLNCFEWIVIESSYWGRLNHDSLYHIEKIVSIFSSVDCQLLSSIARVPRVFLEKKTLPKYAQRGARTHDPEIKSLMLYRLS